MNPPPFKGGQGRTSADVETSGEALLWTVTAVGLGVIAYALLAALGAI